MINLLDDNPLHIAGVVVKTFPRDSQEVAGRLQELPGTQVHMISETGALVVTVETADSSDLLIETISQFDHIQGVLASSLVFHHQDTGAPETQG